MKVIKIIFKAIIWCLVLSLLLLNVYSFMSIKLFGNKITNFNGYSPLEVVSGSMEPTIKVGDMIIINTKVKDYQVDDIVTFIDVNGAFVTHRIIEETDSGYVTKGDNNESKDQELITKNDIVGVYQYRLKGFGILLTSLKSPLTFIIILIIGVILCVLASTDKDGKPLDVDDEYLEFLKYKKENKKKKKEDLSSDESNTLDKKDEVEVKEDKKESNKNSKKCKANDEEKYYNDKEDDKDVKSTTKKSSTKKTSNSSKKSYNTKKKEDVSVEEKKEVPKKTTKKSTTSGTKKKSSSTSTKKSTTKKSTSTKKTTTETKKKTSSKK